MYSHLRSISSNTMTVLTYIILSVSILYGYFMPSKACTAWWRVQQMITTQGQDTQSVMMNRATCNAQYPCYTETQPCKTWSDSLSGLVDKVSASGAEDPGFESCFRQDFSGLSHTSDSKIGTPVATLPGAWHYRVSAGTGQPSVSILWLGEAESMICIFHFSVAARKLVCASPSLRYTSMFLGL